MLIGVTMVHWKIKTRRLKVFMKLLEIMLNINIIRIKIYWKLHRQGQEY